MSNPIPEEGDQPAGPTEAPPGEHPSELPDGAGDQPQDLQQENAGSSLDQPSDDSGGG